MNATVTDERALAAAEAAVGLLPAATPLVVGTPTDGPVDLSGQAVTAQFTGSAQGEIVVVVGSDLVEALASSPLGALDLGQAVRPALEAAATTLGPVVVDPGTEADPADAMRSVLSAGGLLVPLTDAGEVRALVALAVEVQIGATGDVEPIEVDLADVFETPPADAAGGPTVVPTRPVSAGFAPLTPGPRGAPVVRGGLELLHDVDMELTAELGRTRLTVRELLGMSPGAVIELDRIAGAPSDLLVNGRLIARGEVVVIDENFGIRITEIVP